MKTRHRPVKSLGQNFLNDLRIGQKIVKTCDLNQEDVVVEIGPGQGALTKEILPFVKKVIAIEKDRNLIDTLKSQFDLTHFEVIHADFLTWNMDSLKQQVVVVGNIPYYISTPIIEKIISHKKTIKKAFLTVQLEFGNRLAAKEGNKDYGSLSCFVQYYFDVKVLFKISKGSFYPAPKVDSCFVSLIPRSTIELKADHEEYLFKMIQKAFMQRRKTILNALKGLVEQQKLLKELEGLKISPQARAEQISLLNYIKLSNSLMI